MLLLGVFCQQLIINRLLQYKFILIEGEIYSG